MTLSSEGSHFCFVFCFFSSHFVSNFQFLHHHNHQAQPQAVFPLISVSLGCDPPRLPKPPRGGGGGEGCGFPPAGSWVIKTTVLAYLWLNQNVSLQVSFCGRVASLAGHSVQISVWLGAFPPNPRKLRGRKSLQSDVRQEEIKQTLI